ncbi:MAG: class I SAM-dependent methyltransferase [Actinomycetota bacterium]|nr:class I SAM-dependent methyltransferase [Actinomycetota bacterium]
MGPLDARQSPASLEQNAEFFARDSYAHHAAQLDSHRLMRAVVTKELQGGGGVLDVGNGGVFEYDPSVVEAIVAVDLFLDELPQSHFPPNVTARRGDALALEEPTDHYDIVVETFVFHHLAGEKPGDLVTNTRRALAEAEAPLKPGGRLIVAESCVPRWFYVVEKLLFRALRVAARTPLLGGHPATLQLPFETLVELVGERFDIERAYELPLGRWVTQFGRRWPRALTPVRAYLIAARRRP